MVDVHHGILGELGAKIAIIILVKQGLAFVQSVNGDLRICRLHSIPAISMLNGNGSEEFLHNEVLAFLGQPRPITIARERRDEQIGETLFGL